jgi:hypothetical protein
MNLIAILQHHDSLLLNNFMLEVEDSTVYQNLSHSLKEKQKPLAS